MQTGQIKSNNVATINPLADVTQYGQSIWLDYIRRSLVTSGDLRRMIEADSLRGVTSNPAIFEKAIAGSSDYKKAFEQSASSKKLKPKDIYELLAIEDIQMAADEMAPVYKKTSRRDGYVSLEVSPHLARDTKGTIEEAQRLWKSVSRENLMIKVPATLEGIPAVQRLISEGINVNVTLIFSQGVYLKVAEAYIAGLEKLAAQKGDLSKVASVASFFISRIDSAVDKELDELIKNSKSDAETEKFKWLQGKIAIANAKVVYAKYRELFSNKRWLALGDQGAQTQRLLWASTGTKNPQLSDVLYVEELIGKDTVNTVPPNTYEAFKDHGQARSSLEEGVEEARKTMSALDETGIFFFQVAERLLTDGLTLFSKAFDRLMCAVEAARSASKELIAKQTYQLPSDLQKQVDATLEDWQANGKARRLWSRDASLWTGKDENKWLGWLGITEEQISELESFRGIAKKVQSEKFSHILLLGMGGSSLCPEVLKMTFGHIQGFPELYVLDSTDPAQIRDVEKKIDLARTLFIVSSKSGSTLEPNIFKQYFFERVQKVVGAEKAGSRFVAITDPKSQMQEVAERDRFLHICFGKPSIGGRFSALSNFGMVPAAAMGLDVERFLESAEEMVHACTGCVPAKENPGLVLGVILGVCGRGGRDKITLITSPGIWDLGAWLEQLLAESTGKEGKGLIPVDRERLGSPDIYGQDRVFVYMRLESESDSDQEAAIQKVEKAGCPVVRIVIADRYDIGQEFFRWEIATAVAGSILGINAFNQPDVEASKIATKKLTASYEETGSLPSESPILEEAGIKLFTDEKNAKALASADKSLIGYLKAHLKRLKPGDYLAVLAYIDMSEANEKVLQEIRHTIRDSKQVATCLGFGPRFLHSTGQAYKGGPNSGVFLQITCDDASDLSVPGQKYTFGVVKAAQARGDFQVLAERERRVLRVHLGKNLTGDLHKLHDLVKQSLD